MKFIPSREVNFEHALRVTSEHSPRQIFRIGLDQYVVLNEAQGKMLTAFESVKFSELLNTLRCSVDDIELIATRVILSRDNTDSKETTFEIRLHLENGEGLAFNSDESSFTFKSPSAPSLLDETRKSVHEYWQLPAGDPFNRMLVTEDFAVWMQTLCASSDCVQVIERCWRDYRSQESAMVKLNPGKPILVHGEFGDFYAAEYLCGRVSFHLSK